MMRALRRDLLVVCAAGLMVGLGVSGCGGSAARAHPRPGSTTSAPAGATTAVRPPPASSTATTGTATSTAATPTPAASVSYGIADAQGQFARCAPGTPSCCDSTAVHCRRTAMDGYFDNPLFLRLTTPASAHRVSEIRLFVDYDAVEEWNGSSTAPGCVYSRALDQNWSDLANGQQTAGESIDDLRAGVIEARAEGLEPVVAIAGYQYPTAKPPWDIGAPDPTTTSGYWAYRCGIQGILSELSRLPEWAQPHVWEAFNEPEGFAIFNGSENPATGSCAVGATPQPDGPAKAACYEAIASAAIHGFAGHAGDTVLAGAFKRPTPAYLAAYAAEIGRVMPGADYPPDWSVHDYGEVTGAFASASSVTTDDSDSLAAFDEALAQDTGGRARSLWITEAGTVLTSEVRAGGCAAAGVDPAGSLGACVNGRPARQSTSAAAFFALPTLARAVPITHLFWYQFEGAPGWDSGLADAAGQPRASYCAFYGSGVCHGSPDAS